MKIFKTVVLRAIDALELLHFFDAKFVLSLVPPAHHPVSSVEDVQRTQLSERAHNDNRTPLPSTQPQVPILTQQQQFEVDVPALA